MEKTICTGCAALCACLSFLFGAPDGLLVSLLVFMALDYGSGVLVALTRKALSSAIGFRGLAKKGGILILIAVGHLLDTQLIGSGSACRSAILGFYLSNEGISILENLGALGLPLPKKLRRVLAQLQTEESE